MFAKRKPRQDDEPLVPHGLVWQATDAIVPEKNGRTDVPVTKKNLADEIEASSSQPPEAAQAAVASLPKEPSVSSPPLFWRPRGEPEIVKADGPRPASKPRLQAGPQADNRKLVDSSAPVAQTLPSLFQRFGVAGSDTASAGLQGITRIATDFRSNTREFSRRFSGAMQHVRIRLRVKHSAFKLKARFRGMHDSSSTRLSRLAACLRRYGANCKTLANPHLTKTIAHTKLQSGRIRAMRLNLVRGEFQQASWRGMQQFRMRVRLAGLPLRMRILLTRAISEWRLKADNAGTDSRLLTAMTLGLCTALLALAIVSSARHYGNASLPSHLVHSGASQVPAATTSANAITKQPVRAEFHTKAQAARTIRPRPISMAARTRLKPSRKEDDDYVARDTYVYYGDSRAKSR